MNLRFRSDDQIFTDIHVDYTKNTVEIENYTDNIILRAFGANEHPTIEDFENFLEDRCIPRSKDMMKLHLREIGVDRYDPYEIVRKTGGRISDDCFYLENLDDLEKDDRDME